MTTEQINSLTPMDIQILLNASISQFNYLEAKVKEMESGKDDTNKDNLPFMKNRLVEIQEDISTFDKFMAGMCHTVATAIRHPKKSRTQKGKVIKKPGIIKSL